MRLGTEALWTGRGHILNRDRKVIRESRLEEENYSVSEGFSSSAYEFSN